MRAGALGSAPVEIVFGSGVNKAAFVVEEFRFGQEPALRQLIEPALPVVERRLRRVALEPEALVDFLIEIFQKGLVGLLHARLNGLVQLELQLVESVFDLGGGAAVLENGCDALLEIHAGFQRAEHLVVAPKTPSKSLNFSLRISKTRWSAALLRFRKLTTTTSCCWP